MLTHPLRLGVNIDHIANVRQARRTVEPDPVSYALLAELGRSPDAIAQLLAAGVAQAHDPTT